MNGEEEDSEWKEIGKYQHECFFLAMTLFTDVMGVIGSEIHEVEEAVQNYLSEGVDPIVFANKAVDGFTTLVLALVCQLEQATGMAGRDILKQIALAYSTL